MSRKDKICIVGPAVQTNYIGGVATHIKNMKSLSCFSDAVVLDPGSVNSTCHKGTISVVKSIFEMCRIIKRENFRHIFLNSSIYPSAIIKLFLILCVLPINKRTNIRVFFHGGRFDCLSPLKASVFRKLFCFALKKVRSFHFLSSVQLEGFRSSFRGILPVFMQIMPLLTIFGEKNIDVAHDSLELLFRKNCVRAKGVDEDFPHSGDPGRRSEVRLQSPGHGSDLQDSIRGTGDFEPGTIRFLGLR